MIPVLVARSAWQTILGEVERFAARGLREHGSPFEAIVYPLAAMIPAPVRGGELRCPLELVELADIGALVIADAMLPPDEAKVFSPMNCHFAGDGIADLNLAFNRQIDERLALHPRLSVLSKLHSHPFVGGDFLSGGDLAKNVFAPQAVAWRERRGLATALMHVVNPGRSPALGPDGELVDCHWQLSSWGLADGHMVAMQTATVVPDDHPAVRAALSPPYYLTPAGAAWCNGQKQALREAGFSPSRNVLGRGWRRYLVSAGGRELCLALPPDLPRRPPRVLEVLDVLTNAFVPVELPRAFRAPTSLDEVDLVAICRKLARSRTRRRAVPRRTSASAPTTRSLA